MASSETAAAVQRDSEEHATLRRVAVSSFLGNFIEWFDYASYSYFATVIALVLMPPGDPTVALLETFGVFALSFLMRPVGAFFWGHMGDKKGRKWALAPSILKMSAATFLAEYAPSNHRGLYCSLVPASTATGLLIGSALATFMFMTWGHDSSFVTEWGWRIPFLLAGPLGLITHYIRTRVSDSPVYQEMQEKLEAKGESDDKPIKLLLTKHLRPLLVSFGACMLNAVGFYAVLTYLPNYLQDTVGYDAGSSSLITTICLVAYIAFIFLSGRISDKVGRKKMLIIACVGFIIFTVPAFYLLNSQNFAIILIVELVMCLLLTINDGTLSSYLSETFPTEVRYSGFALSFNFANAIFGGSASFISIALIEATGNAIAPAWYMVAISVVAFIAMCMTHDNSKKKLTEIQ